MKLSRSMSGVAALALAASLLLPAPPASPAGTATSGIRFRYGDVYPMVSEMRAVAVADLTGDGLDDAVVTTAPDQTADPPRGSYELLLFEQGPIGVFRVTERHPTDWGIDLGVATGDLNADRRADVAVSTGSSVLLFHQKPSGGLAAAGEAGEDIEQPETLDVADVDKDGWADIAVHARDGIYFLSNQSGSFIQVPVSPVEMREVRFAEMTGDGRLDIVSTRDNFAYIFEQQSEPAFLLSETHEARFRGEFQPERALAWSWAVGDVTNDRRTDLVMAIDDRGNTEHTTLNVFAQKKEGGLKEPTTRAIGTTPLSMTIADVDRDRRNDVVISHSIPSPRIGILRGTSSGLAREVFRRVKAGLGENRRLATARVGGKTLGILDAISRTGLTVLRNPPPLHSLVSTRLREISPTLSSGYVGFGRARRGRPRFTDAYLRTPNGRMKKINRAGTQGWAGNIDRGRMVYQEATRRDSGIVFYDLSSGRRSSPGAVNDRRNWQWAPFLSGRYLLYGQTDWYGSGHTIQLRDLRDRYTRELDYEGGFNVSLTPGQLNGDHAVWTVCKRICNVRTYRISKYGGTKIPNPQGLTTYAGSVGSDGTVFFARSGYGCGKNVRIMMKSPGQPARVVRHLPPGIDLLESYLGEDRRGRPTLAFSRVVCRTWQWDIYRL